MFEWADDLKIQGIDLYMDSRQTRQTCFVSHAHTDHVGIHETAIATAETAALAEQRLGVRGVRELAYGESMGLDPDTVIKLLPAGHVLGSAMLHVRRPEGTLLYTGDFKLRECLTVPRAEPCAADVLVMESTFGQPFFRFPHWRTVADELVELCETGIREGRQPIVMGYSLGKGQEAVRILTDAGLPVTLHGAVHALSGIYNRFGVLLGNYRRYRYEDFHGPQAIDMRCRGVLVAPPHVARSGFVRRFDNPLRIVLTGWSLLKNAVYRYGVDHALPLSDHADFDELLEMVERVRPKKIYTHHGYAEFAEHLRSRGHDAAVARPERQLSLFD